MMLDLICILLRDSFLFLNVLIIKFYDLKVKVIIVDLLKSFCFDVKVVEVISMVFFDIFLNDLFSFKVVNMWLVEIILILSNFDVIE